MKIAVPILLLLLGGLAWFVFASPAEAPPVAVESAATIEDDDVGSASSSGLTEVDDGAEDSSNRVEVESERGERPGPRVRVVDATVSPRKPMGGAQVFWIERRDAYEKNEGKPYLHQAQLALRYGARAKTDDEGYVQLPSIRDRLIVTARKGGLFGTRSLRRNGRVETLPMYLDQTLVVVVRDDAGNGVEGVPVGLHEKERRGWDRRTRVDSDADGRVTVPHFQLFRDRIERASQFVAALHVPLPEPVLKEFAAEPLPKEPIELRMPATGSVAVRILDPDGEPFPNPARVTLQVSGRPKDWSVLGRSYDIRSQRRGLSTQQIVFPFVGLDMQLVPRVRLDDDDFTWDGEATTGPMRAGERVELDVSLPDWIGLLAGRLVDADGEPFARRKPTLLVTGRAGRIEGERLETDDDGRFELPFRIRKVSPPFALEIRDEDDGEYVGAQLSLPSLNVGKRTDLGDVVLEGLGTIAFGTIVNDRGEPVEAQVRLERLRDLGGTPPRTEWRDEAFVDTRAGEQGEYELRGDPPPSRLRIEVRARNHMIFRSEEIVVGSRIDVTLQRTGTLRGNILAPKWLPDRVIDAKLISAEDPQRTVSTRPRSRMGRVSFWFPNLEPGLYDLSLRLRGFPDEVFRRDGLRIEPGLNDVKDKVGAIDLADSIFRFQLEAVSSDGRPIGNLGSPLVAKVARPNGEVEPKAFQWRGNKLEIYSASPRLEVVQLGTGYRPKEAVLSYGESRLMFEKLQPLVLEMPGIRAACGEGRRVRISAVLISDTGLPEGMRAYDQRRGSSRGYSRAALSKSGGAWLGESDTVQMPLMRDGEYRVVARLYEGGLRSPVSRTIGRIQVALDPIRPQTVRVAIDQKSVQAALNEIQKRKAANPGK